MSGFSGRPPTGLPKTAVIGSTGFIGRVFLRAYRGVYPDCAATARRNLEENVYYLDLLDPDISGMRLFETGHREALILAGVTRIAACEEDKDGTRRVNVEGTLELVRQLVEEGVKPVFTSTDYVFDGASGNYPDGAPANPITEYGRQKAEVEGRIGGIAGEEYLVLRLGKVFSLEKGDGTLLDEMARVLASGGTVRAAFDQIMNPVLIDDLIKAVFELQMSGARGTVNVCHPEAWSRYDIAVKMARAMGADAGRVVRISLDDLGPGPRRPKDTSMQTGRLSRETRCVFTPLSKNIDQVAKNWKGG